MLLDDIYTTNTFAFQTSQALLRMLVWGPHVENQGLQLETESLDYKTRTFKVTKKGQTPAKHEGVGGVSSYCPTGCWLQSGKGRDTGDFLIFLCPSMWLLLLFQILFSIDYEDGVNPKEGNDP